MLARTKLVTGLLAAAALLSAVPAAHAGGVIGVAPYLGSVGDTTIAATCSVHPSGASIDPSANPYYVAGNAVVESTQVVVSTALHCRLRDIGTGQQIGEAQTALSGAVTVAAGVIPVATRGPFEICTSVDLTFSDTSRFHSGEVCRPITGA